MMDDKTKVQLCRKIIEAFFDDAPYSESGGASAVLLAVMATLNFGEEDHEQ